MGKNFIACDREQSFLLPPDVREWLPEDHFAWFVLDAVAQMDLAAFYGAYRADGHAARRSAWGEMLSTEYPHRPTVPPARRLPGVAPGPSRRRRKVGDRA